MSENSADGPRRVFVAGATGVIGHRTVRRLVEQGHRVTGVARSEAKASLLRTLGAEPARVDLFDAAAVEGAVDGHDVVVNLATHIPPFTEAGDLEAWATNDRLRAEGSANLSRAARRTGATRFVQESLGFMYPDMGDAWIDEEVEPQPGRVAETALTAEANARAFAETTDGGTAVVLRFGQFYGPDAGHTQDMVKMARWWIAPAMGPRDAFLTHIHLDDAADAVVAALELPGGVYNVVDSEPVTRATYAEVMAEAVGHARLFFLPRWLVERMGDGVEMLSRSQRVSNGKLRDASHWQPQYPSVRAGLPPVVEEIRAAT